MGRRRSRAERAPSRTSPLRLLTSPRRTPRQARSKATVDVLLDATARILRAVGYDRASTNRVAEAAGVSIGSLYQYFPSKEALVAALAERHVAQMVAVITSKLGEVADAPLEQGVRAVIRVMFEAHAVDPRLHKILVEQVPRIGKLEQVVGVEREVEALVGAYLAARRADVRPERLDAAAFVLCRAVEATTHAAVLEPLDAARAAAVEAELVDMVLRYLPATPADRRRSAKRQARGHE